MKKVLSLGSVMLLLVLIFASLMPTASAAPEIWDGKRAFAFAGGSGTKDDPWQISNGAELAYMAHVFNTTVLKDTGETYGHDYFVLTNDIYLNDVSNYDNWGLGKDAPANKWANPIGLAI